jgi:carboxylesterase type B
MRLSKFVSGMLFHRAILMSGSSLSPWALIPDPSRTARHVAASVNCSVELADAQLLKCLRERPLDALLRVPAPPLHAADGALEMTSVNGHFSASVYGPSVDGVVIDAPPPLNNAWAVAASAGQQRGASIGAILDTLNGMAGGSSSINPEEMMQKKYIEKLGR